MTGVSYVLENGVEVKSFREVQESGMSYKTKYSQIPETPSKMTEKRKAMRVSLK